MSTSDSDNLRERFDQLYKFNQEKLVSTVIDVLYMKYNLDLEQARLVPINIPKPFISYLACFIHNGPYPYSGKSYHDAQWID